jgi:cholestenol delta-isomerase
MAAGNFTLLPGQSHPYYPVEAQIAGLVLNKWNTLELVSMFAGGCAVIFGITYMLVKRIRPTLSNGDLATIMWFVLCGCIHSFFEGYFAYNFRTMGSMQDLFGQLWKEYSLSDSRYLTQDAFVLCMETVTAVSCPLSCTNAIAYPVPGLLGSSVLRFRRPHRLRPPPPLPSPAHRLARPVLR